MTENELTELISCQKIVVDPPRKTILLENQSWKNEMRLTSIDGEHRFYVFIRQHGVKDSSKARLVAVACLEFQIRNIAYTSVIVHEDFSSLSKKDQRIITNAADKQFYGFEDFKVQGEKYLSHLNN